MKPKGDYGKPELALIVQSDFFNEYPSVAILPVTSELRETPLFRIRLEPTASNGLRKVTEVMVDKAQSVPRERLVDVFGNLGEEEILMRESKYLNNLVEQDHRAGRRTTRPMMGFKSFLSAWIIVGEIETMHMIKKRQMNRVVGSTTSSAGPFYGLPFRSVECQTLLDSRAPLLQNSHF